MVISRSVWPVLAAVPLAAAAAVMGSQSASAGECPADKVIAEAQQSGPTMPMGVADKVLASIDLANEPVALKDHRLRLRRLVIKPGGVVAWHSHTDRPAIIYIISGSIVEYRSTCAVPIVHKAGESAAEVKGMSHWWKNTGNRTVVLLSADLFHARSNPHTM